MFEFVEIELRSGKISYFENSNKLDIKPESWVIVEVERGLDIAKVVNSSYFTEDESIGLHNDRRFKVVRTANDEDHENYEKVKEREQEATEKFLMAIEKYPFEMKLIDTVFQFDLNKLTFFFTADGRVDFREFVRELAGIFRTRIELHQISGRDVARRVGGMGMCGYNYCCTSFLKRFSQITIKMVKDQNLSGNLSKISGPCGRLLCCLDYEQEFYQEWSKEFPEIGEELSHKGTKMIVTKNDYYNKRVSLIDDDENLELITLDEYKKIKNRRRNGRR